ncbi:41974_t:CDS:2, partial [Gigaspora margarita]
SVCYYLGKARFYEILQLDVYKIETKTQRVNKMQCNCTQIDFTGRTSGRENTRMQEDKNSIHINQPENSNIAGGQLHEQMGAKRQSRAANKAVEF